MYTVSKGPNNIVAKTRRGYNQKLDSRSLSGDKESNKKGSSSDLDLSPEMSSPKPVFQPLNGKRAMPTKQQTMEISAQHEEMIKYAEDAWNRAMDEFKTAQSLGEKSGLRVRYHEEDTKTHLQGTDKARKQQMS
ncbi:unnamed protein product [Cyprideis torosa]|uniref:Uncharacterized protein n=1 Tax=Cyprideis torosa TaxID=163714 RepID=A0A7R8WC69_9CRUS|nr:unnamed protein product [Cyprideis torosa]CAG0893107.1 unnamed protein product [Cyprideis torosa]